VHVPIHLIGKDFEQRLQDDDATAQTLRAFVDGQEVPTQLALARAADPAARNWLWRARPLGKGAIMGTKKSDTEIKGDVLRELSWDTRVSSTEVGVQVTNGVVTLTGNIDSWAKRTAAEQAAHRVAGVLDVANDLEVRLPGGTERSDGEIAQSVRKTLEWDVTVPDKDIRSTVSKGIVTLEGHVPFWSHRYDAEHAVERLSGVKSVVNRIEISPPPPQVNTGDVRSAIQNALERHADREAARLDVRVTDGGVEVTGVVHTWSEKDAVLGAVRGTRGVRNVTDHLSVQPYT
jgi:osmotically-inducible protein OsmY